MTKYSETWYHDTPGKDKDGFIIVPLPATEHRFGSGATPTLYPEQVIVTQEHGRVTAKEMVR